MANKKELSTITQATLFAYQLPFKKALKFKQYTLHSREGLILSVTDDNSVNRCVEITPLPGFSHETLVEVKAELMAFSTLSISHLLAHKSCYPSVQFALDSLRYNRQQINANQLVTMDNVALLQGNKEQIVAQYLRLNRPQKIKLKVARESVAVDIENFQHLCQLNPQVKIRCDANQAWTEQQAAQFFQAINSQQIDYIEEPTADHQINLQLAERYNIHIALDETLQQPDFIYHHHQAISAFVIKPTIVGSKEKIDQLVSIASKKSIQVSFSSSFESIVGLQILQQLASHYLQHYPQLTLSLGIDTLKYFSGELLIKEDNIEQDCRELETLWTIKR